MEGKFTEEDKSKFVEFLNIVAKNAQFNMNTSEIIKYFGLLSFIQKDLLTKIDANILEVTKVVEASENKEE